ncbi:hypothetical protein [Oceanobacillus manasiensis]|nr:hypothetical protein [Oceanobacillus manasiensis]
MHQDIYSERLEINAILHASSFYSTLIANRSTFIHTPA